MTTVRQAQEIILKQAARTGIESISFLDALNRILAEDVHSNRNHPPYDISAMDGYALRHDDIKGADKEKPVELEVGHLLHIYDDAIVFILRSLYKSARVSKMDPDPRVA